MRASIFGVLLALAAFCGSAAAATDGSAIVGTWATDDGSSHIAIAAAGDRYDGRVVWLQEPRFASNDADGMAGQPKVDRKNPDAALRTRPVMGLTVLSGLRYGGDNAWEGGTLYAPATGKSFPCKASLASDGTLKLAVGGSVFGRTVTWTRIAVGK